MSALWNSSHRRMPFRYQITAAGMVWVTAAAMSTAALAQVPLGAEFVGQVPGGLGGSGQNVKTQIVRAPGRPHELFVSALNGPISRVDLRTNLISPYVTIPDVDQSSPDSFVQWGLLGIRFAPDFETSGHLYVFASDDRDAAPGAPHHTNYVRRYTVSDPMSDAPTLSEPTTILRFEYPGNDHNGGWIDFQPDNPDILWILSGDGQNSDSNPNPIVGPSGSLRSGQDPGDLLGSILRIDLSGDDFPTDPDRNYRIPANNPHATGDSAFTDWLPELWSIGHRSPWGASFDRVTGDFIMGEVGQVTREEINFQRHDPVTGYDDAAGRNYGWRVMEGHLCFDRGEYPGDECASAHLPPASEFTAPLLDYDHSGFFGSGNSQPFEGRSVTGGYVYRGPVAELRGLYVFGDWSSRQVWAIKIDRDAQGGLGGVVDLRDPSGETLLDPDLQCEDAPGACLDLTSAFDRPIGASGSFGSGVTAFGEDEVGNLYFVEAGGNMYKIVGEIVPEPGAWVLLACGLFALPRRRS